MWSSAALIPRPTTLCLRPIPMQAPAGMTCTGAPTQTRCSTTQWRPLSQRAWSARQFVLAAWTRPPAITCPITMCPQSACTTCLDVRLWTRATTIRWRHDPTAPALSSALLRAHPHPCCPLAHLRRARRRRHRRHRHHHRRHRRLLRRHRRHPRRLLRHPRRHHLHLHHPHTLHPCYLPHWRHHRLHLRLHLFRRLHRHHRHRRHLFCRQRRRRRRRQCPRRRRTCRRRVPLAVGRISAPAMSSWRPGCDALSSRPEGVTAQAA
mmetsp:Transcript_22464/g.55407  ORF Transcript_22464/g.55407 Transcript_22464/m.55407 type:complete len:264 (+) Transcript_22464:109-900(+)